MTAFVQLYISTWMEEENVFMYFVIETRLARTVECVTFLFIILEWNIFV